MSGKTATTKNYSLHSVAKFCGSCRTNTFALAEDFQDGKYLKLNFGNVSDGEISLEYFLVKAEIAKEQKETKIITSPPEKNDNNNGDGTEPPPPKLTKHFSMDVKPDKKHYIREVRNYIEEVSSHLMNLPGAETSIRLVINISVPEGISDDTKEMVSANCRDLRIENFNFES